MKRLLFLLLTPMVVYAQVTAPPAALDNWPTANTTITLGDAGGAGGTGAIVAWDETDNKFVYFTIGSGLVYTHSTHTLAAATGGGGTVTSFSAGDLAPIFTTTEASVTTTPALSFTLSNAGAHSFLGNNTGSSATPSYVQPNFTDLAGFATTAQGGLPTGGTTSQILQKTSNADYAVGWTTPSAGSGTVTTTGSPATNNLTKFSGATSITNGDLTGDVTTSGTLTTTIPAGTVTLAKMANMATASLIYRRTAATGVPEVTSLSLLKTDLGLTGTNSGDQIVPVTTTATGGQFFTAYDASTGVFTKGTPAGAGTVTNDNNLTTNAVVLGGAAGTTATKVVTGIVTDGASILTLGVGSTAGGLAIKNTNNSAITLVRGGAAAPTYTLTLPDGNNDNLVGRQSTDTLINKTFTSADVVDSTGLVYKNSNNASITLLRGGVSASAFTVTLPEATTTLLGSTATGVQSFLTTPSSANLATAVTDETGTGALVFGTSPAITTPTGIVKGDVGLGNVDNTSDASKNSATATLTNKRINPRVSSISSNATWSPNADTDDEYVIYAQAVPVTTISNPTNTPVEGQKLIIRVKDNGTARAISGWGSNYRFSSDLPAPLTTVAGKGMYLGFIYTTENSTVTKWDCVAIINNF